MAQPLKATLHYSDVVQRITGEYGYTDLRSFLRMYT